MVQVTRTTNPIPLQDLEPHRFEDLVRQLLYDFRNWRRLESTGRSGSDDGFDARGWEIVSEGEPQVVAEDGADGQDIDLPNVASDRIWLIQCTREKEIGPTRLVGFVEAIPPEEAKQLHGIVLAAACEFSKKARDDFREACRARGIQEWHLWSRSEIEDMLFRPANDHLLFGYFGFSLLVRKRSLKSEISARLTTKRRLKKHVIDRRNFVLIRDANDERYPYLDPDESKRRKDRGHWRVWSLGEMRHDGLTFLIERHHAYLSTDGKEWDHAGANMAALNTLDDPWATQAEFDANWKARCTARDKWDTLAQENRATYTVHALLPFDNIIAIDEMGDDVYSDPQIIVATWKPDGGPFEGFFVEVREDADKSRVLFPESPEDGRTVVFATIIPPPSSGLVEV